MSLLYLNPKGRIQMLAHAMPTHGLLNRGCLAIEIIMVRVKVTGKGFAPHIPWCRCTIRPRDCAIWYIHLHKYDAVS